MLRHGAVAASWRVPLALLPLLGGAAAAVAIVRQLARFDELQRRMQFDAISLAFLGTAFLTFGYGFLEGVGLPRLSMFVVWPVMGGLWAVGSIASIFRFRR